jgi:hypothetical protein
MSRPSVQMKWLMVGEVPVVIIKRLLVVKSTTDRSAWGGNETATGRGLKHLRA